MAVLPGDPRRGRRRAARCASSTSAAASGSRSGAMPASGATAPRCSRSSRPWTCGADRSVLPGSLPVGNDVLPQQGRAERRGSRSRWRTPPGATTSTAGSSTMRAITSPGPRRQRCSRARARDCEAAARARGVDLDDVRGDLAAAMRSSRTRHGADRSAESPAGSSGSRCSGTGSTFGRRSSPTDSRRLHAADRRRVAQGRSTSAATSSHRASRCSAARSTSAGPMPARRT